MIEMIGAGIGDYVTIFPNGNRIIACGAFRARGSK
jgi:hypothetical protein